MVQILYNSAEIMENLVDLSESETDSWLSLRQASGRLGISPATLRGWADEGRVQSYRTPGGHRRFRVGEGGIETKPRRSETRWRVLEHSALGRLNLARVQSGAAPVSAELIAMEREWIQLLVRGLKNPKEDWTRADALGQALAKFNWRNGKALRETFEWFGMFRNAFLESVVEFAFGMGEPDVDELNLWLRRANEIIDRVWISMLEYRTEDEKPTARKR